MSNEVVVLNWWVAAHKQAQSQGHFEWAKSYRNHNKKEAMNYLML